MRFALFWIILAVICSAYPENVLADSVRMELITEPGTPIEASQRWLKSLSQLELVSLRIRSGKPGERADVSRSGRSIRVVGILTRDNRLLLPGGKFTINDRKGIAGWLQKVRSGKDPAEPEDKAAFGLSSEQLVNLHGALAKPVQHETKGRAAHEVVKQIVRPLEYETMVAESADRTLHRSDSLVMDELKGVSSGTALAALLRPFGLALVPKPVAGSLQLTIADVRDAPESWPVGWPPEKPDRELLPKFFDFVPVEILDQPIGTVINFLQPRMGVPFLLDHNSLVREQIDLETAKVSFPSKRTFYKKLIDQVLFKARLKEELRVDESGEPFLWISPLKSRR